MPSDHTKWANKQVAAAFAIGVNPIDAQNSVAAFLALLPPGADPDTYTLPAQALEQELPSQRMMDDLRADWYSDADPRYARLLDATEAE